MKKAAIEIISWKDISAEIAKINPELANVINEISPDDSYHLYKTSYPFGSTILENGAFHVPLPNGGIVRLSDPLVRSQLKLDLEYASGGLPVGILLKNSYELYINNKNSILPILITNPGSVVALWKELELTPTFHPSRLFSINAGARSVFMLPNISDLALHKNLKRDFNVRQPPPKNLISQWDIFKTISNHPDIDCNWSTEILFFSEKWIKSIKHDKSWHALLLLLLENVWNSSSYERNRMFYDFTVSCAQSNRNLKPNPYITDTLRHLLMIGLGTGIGFCVATDDRAAPISLLQKIYLESYGLRRYAPIFMHPAHFSLHQKCNPVYYSLSLPTTLAFSPKSRKISSTIHDLSELKHILDVFLDEVTHGHLNIDDTIIGKLATHVNFDFFHSKQDRHKEIKLTNDMTIGDSALIYSLNQYGKRDLAESGTFIRGCIRISAKDNN